ncbi:C-reactive protein-like isoform X2 [Paramisgurnus dabryanus]|uniref:C-reactive protein-like isoform X2 n=1 Tax=Paramisgurnus dabryanus TaxID=90735 RepID=UPI0031F3676D
MCKMLELAVFLLCLLPLTSGGLADKVLLFPQKTDDSYVKITPEKPLNLTAFTLCMRIATEQHGAREGILFAYVLPDMDDLSVWMQRDKSISLHISPHFNKVRFNLPTLLSTFRSHLCLTWSSSTGLTAAWMNGQRSINQIHGIGLAVRPGGTVLLGQNPNSFLGNFYADQSFVGEITDVNLWDEVLTAKEIEGVYANTATVKVPNVINWRRAEYEIHGNVKLVDI